MRIAIFYGSPIKLSPDHVLINSASQPQYYVRMEIANLDNDDLSDSLKLARPMEMETFLNTIPMP